ncbi:MAG TPA: MtrB/PioB family decaheme-associated outer membrane protein [Thermoanaerobaculia bacterium]|nr:MtrB/PioB family decaheme-associated outer membrane protein [Thermoanaerobaculia bacterium]
MLTRAQFLSPFAAALLAAAPAARAHQTDDFHFHLEPIVLEVLDVDVDTNSSKFNEYRDIRSGFNLPRLRIFGESGDGDRTFALRADNVRRDDARYTLDYGVAGRYSFQLDYNKIPHRFGNGGTLLWNRTGRGLLELPDPVQAQLQGALEAQFVANRGGVNFPFLAGLLAPHIAAADSIDLAVQRDRTRARVEVKKLQPLSYSFEVRHENRSGMRPYGAAFGFGNAIELFEPTEYDTTDATAQAEWTAERGGLRAGYRHSRFQNEVSTLTWDNIWRATNSTDPTAYLGPGASSVGGSSRGFADLAPDNDADMLFVDGRLKFGSGWKLSGNVHYSQMSQDDPLLPYTLNTAIVGVDHATGATFDPTLVSNLPATSANAEAKVVNVNANLTKDLTPDLELTLRYRYDDYDNQSPRIEFPGYVRFHGVWEEIPRITVPYAFTRDELAASLDWDVAEHTSLGFSYRKRNMDREFREVEDADEDVFELSVDSRPMSRLTLRASWETGDRSISEYLLEAQEFSFLDPEGPNNLPGLRKYDEAAREFDDWEVSASLQLSDAWHLMLGVSGREEDYDESRFGLVADEILQLNGEVNYAPSATWNVYLFGHLAERESFQQARQSGATPSINPLDDWNLTLDETTDTWGLGITGNPDGKWSWDLSANWSRSDGEADFFTPPGGRAVVDFDNYEDIELTAVVAKIDYQINPRASVGVSYRYEDYTLDSFNLNGLRPYLPATILLVANDGDYQADVFGVRLKLNM